MRSSPPSPLLDRVRRLRLSLALPALLCLLGAVKASRCAAQAGAAQAGGATSIVAVDATADAGAVDAGGASGRADEPREDAPAGDDGASLAAAPGAACLPAGADPQRTFECRRDATSAPAHLALRHAAMQRASPPWPGWALRDLRLEQAIFLAPRPPRGPPATR